MQRLTAMAPIRNAVLPNIKLQRTVLGMLDQSILLCPPLNLSVIRIQKAVNQRLGLVLLGSTIDG
jgi:hypothetical protein